MPVSDSHPSGASGRPFLDPLGQPWPAGGPPRRLSVLGSTGSIGRQTLEVASWLGAEIRALAADRDVETLLAQVERWRPALVRCHRDVEDAVRRGLPPGTALVTGEAGLVEAATLDVDAVVAAVPGFSGLAPVRAALAAGRHVALATKEAMVCAGPLVWREARSRGGRLTPVDSEHGGLYQALVGERAAGVAGLVLTASGGPFREGPRDLSGVTPEQALAHPTWRMGAKVTIDSATLFNKGLEVIEAHALFEIDLDRVEVIVHPESIVHALVRFRDGSLKAQLGPHDMRLPILYALAAPERPAVPLAPLALTGTLRFFEPDLERFPCLALAYEAGRRGGTAPLVANAADEVAVAAFLGGLLPFDAIARVIERTLDGVAPAELHWDVVDEVDAEARRVADEAVRRIRA
ncbi:MAG: 1-deoxy-D-xylulose-5-phosphate reductoisomerase [Trueperaceae bacterium]|nr:1-deoxy-D-xylulose-5-phosphate reductoisomerase [Trueperaceae bacterium]